MLTRMKAQVGLSLPVELNSSVLFHVVVRDLCEESNNTKYYQPLVPSSVNLCDTCPVPHALER